MSQRCGDWCCSDNKLAGDITGAMISGGADEAGLGQAYAFGLFNLAWAGGQVIGGAGSAGLAQATSDSVPYWLLAGLCLVTALAVRQRGRHAHVGLPLG